MFRKIVTDLAYSPALGEQIVNFDRKLRKEKVTRHLGLAFVILMIAIQLISVIQPPESANNATAKGNNAVISSDKQVITSITASNLSQGLINASSKSALPNDQINYTISAENLSNSPVVFQFDINLTDSIEYFIVKDNGGGTFDNQSNYLSWPEVTLLPKSKQTRLFTMTALDPIPATAQGSAIKTSYDCIASSKFGNTVNIPVTCPVSKVVEQIADQLPNINIYGNIIFAVIILLIAIFYSARSHQLEKEVHLIRKDISSGVA